MRKLFLIAGLAAAIAAPTTVSLAPVEAQAKTACERDRSNTRLAGTIGGGVLGALAGGAIAGRGSNTEGVLIGGALGAVAGNQLLKKKSPCPPGYTARSSYRPARAANTAPRCAWQNQAYRDAYGQVINRQVQVCR